MFNPSIFKAYDIRGIYGTDFDDEFAYQLGKTFVEWRQSELNHHQLNIGVSSDMRLSSPNLKSALIKGMLAAGATVLDYGLCSTPTFYFGVAGTKADGGIQISASHNPKEDNGFKLVRELAKPIGENNGLKDLAAKFADASVPTAAQLIQDNAELPGRLEAYPDILTASATADWASGDWSAIKPFKIIADPANGMGALYLDELFKKLPCSLTRLNWDLDGSFPAHQADPFQAKNLEQLSAAIVKAGADLGIATDGDADRLFFVDETGRALTAGVTRAILCQLFLAERPGAKIGYDIRPGRITPETILAHGGVPVLTRVGHSLIKEQMLKEDIYFAGESSGHFFLNLPDGCFERPMTMILHFLRALSLSGQKLSEFAAPYAKYFDSGEINNRVADVSKVLATLKTKYSDGELNELDGVSITYPEWWFNVRASNTEPLVRLNLEAVSQKIMEEKRDEVLETIKN